MSKTGLVLSGGGVKGLAHLGVLQEIKKNGIKIDAIAGCSAGSIFGALYSAEVDPDIVEEEILKKRLHDFIDFSISKKGIRDAKKLERFIDKLTPKKRFYELNIPLFINSTNLTQGKEKVFSRGSIFLAIRASIAVPGIFEPIRINGEYYVDGGILNQNPLSILPSDIDKIIWVNASPCKCFLNKENYKLTSLIESSYKIMQEEITKLKLKSFKDKEIILIEPEVSDFRFFSREKNFSSIIERGREAAKSMFSKQEDLLKKQKLPLIK